VEVQNDPRILETMPIHKRRNNGGEQKNEMIINSKTLNYMPG